LGVAGKLLETGIDFVDLGKCFEGVAHAIVCEWEVRYLLTRNGPQSEVLVVESNDVVGHIGCVGMSGGEDGVGRNEMVPEARTKFLTPLSLLPPSSFY